MSDVNTSGPFFDKAQAIFKAYRDELEKTLALELNEQVHKNFQVFKNPTGYYASRVSVERNKVTDHGVVYGSWLEKGGKGFRGYRSFEKAAKSIDSEAVQIAEQLLTKKYLGRLN